MSDRSPTDPPGSNRVPSKPDEVADSATRELRPPGEPGSTGSATRVRTNAAPSRQVTTPTEGNEPDPAGRPRSRSDRRWTWPLTNLIGLLVVVLVNALANLLPLNDRTTADVVNRDPVPFQPVGWVFGIWWLIYILLGVFTIYGLLPAGRRNRRLQQISPLFLISNIANIAWLVLWHWERFAASLVVMVVLLVTLIAIYIAVRVRNRPSPDAPRHTKLQRLILWTPFSIYLGWICVAALANLMVWLDRSGWDGGPFSYNVWAALFIVAGALVAALFAFVWNDALIPLVFLWAYIGIAQRQWGESALVSVTAIVFTVVAAALAAVAMLLAFDRTSNLGRFGRAPASSTPQSVTVTRSAGTPDRNP